jgi:hypothetical protein
VLVDFDPNLTRQDTKDSIAGIRKKPCSMGHICILDRQGTSVIVALLDPDA